jgi:hypothetical protein
LSTGCERFENSSKILRLVEHLNEDRWSNLPEFFKHCTKKRSLLSLDIELEEIATGDQVSDGRSRYFDPRSDRKVRPNIPGDEGPSRRPIVIQLRDTEGHGGDCRVSDGRTLDDLHICQSIERDVLA